MLKIIGALMFLGSATLTGFYFSDKLKKRRIFFNDFISFLSLLKTRIRYDGSDIKGLIIQCGDFTSLEPIRSEFTTESPLPVKKLWENGLEKCRSIFSLTGEDIAFLHDFGMELGTTDIQGQMDYISLYEILAQKRLDEAEKIFSQNGKLYKILGFFAGTVAAIMIL